MLGDRHAFRGDPDLIFEFRTTYSESGFLLLFQNLNSNFEWIIFDRELLGKKGKYLPNFPYPLLLSLPHSCFVRKKERTKEREKEREGEILTLIDEGEIEERSRRRRTEPDPEIAKNEIGSSSKGEQRFFRCSCSWFWGCVHAWIFR